MTLTKDRKIEIADWVVDTCLTFGTSVATAFLIASEFIRALEES